jgi:hypothetical protein
VVDRTRDVLQIDQVVHRGGGDDDIIGVLR